VTRTCACACGLSIEHKRPQARFYDDTHRVRGHRRLRDGLQDAQHARDYRRREKLKRIRADLEEVVAEYLLQTRLRSVRVMTEQVGRGRRVPLGQIDASTLLERLVDLPDDELEPVVETMLRSPESTHYNDAMHKRLPPRIVTTEDGESVTVEQQAFDSLAADDPLTRWCMKNRASGEYWSDRPQWVADKGSLGYVPRWRAETVTDAPS
jgi:hypothetical protein